MATFYAQMRHYIEALNNLAAIAGLDSFSFTLANDDAVSWAGATSTDVHDCMKLDASDNFNVGLMTAPGSGGAVALWANGVEKARLLASGALLVGATAAVAGEVVLANVAAVTPVSNTVVGVLANGAGQSTATTAIRGFESQVTTAAAAFTATSLSHFKATGAAAGAGSTITSLYGFRADNAAAVGASNFAFWTDFAAAANKYAIYASGTALNYLNGELGVKSTPATDKALSIGTPTNTGNTLYGAYLSLTAPSTATAALRGAYSVLATNAAAFTLSALTHFYAATTTKGAGSTITNVRGFYAANAIAVGTNNYGFYSDIATAANTYQLAMAGSAGSYFGGVLSVLTVPNADILLYVGGGATHTGTTATTYGIDIDYKAPATATGQVRGMMTVLRTTAAPYTVSSVQHYYANATVLGAGSAATSVIGFLAGNSIAVGTNNYGFYSDINAASNTYQIYMSGTALNLLKGGLILDTTAAPTVGAGQIGFGATVQTTVGAAGGASALPATPTGYMIINVAGTNRVIPYYAAS